MSGLNFSNLLGLPHCHCHLSSYSYHNFSTNSICVLLVLISSISCLYAAGLATPLHKAGIATRTPLANVTNNRLPPPPVAGRADCEALGGSCLPGRGQPLSKAGRGMPRPAAGARSGTGQHRRSGPGRPALGDYPPASGTAGRHCPLIISNPFAH